MRYLFHVHKVASAWRLVVAEGQLGLPAGNTLDAWEHTRTREADDVTADVRHEVGARGYCLFKLGGDFRDVAEDAVRSRTRARSAGLAFAQLTELRFRDARAEDAERLQAIRRAAFAPVFASFRALLGDEIYELAQRREDEAQEALLASLLAKDSGWELHAAQSGEEIVGSWRCGSIGTR